MFVSFLFKISLQFIPYLTVKGGWASHDQRVLGGFAVTSLPVRVEGGWSLGWRGVLEPLLVGMRGHECQASDARRRGSWHLPVVTSMGERGPISRLRILYPIFCQGLLIIPHPFWQADWTQGISSFECQYAPCGEGTFLLSFILYLNSYRACFWVTNT